MMKKNGFTLAEVLITLGIIGVVAALTIPTLMNNYQKKQYVTQLKKFYSQTNSVLKQMSTDNGCVDDLRCSGLFATGTTSDTLGDIFSSYFKVLKNCKTTVKRECNANPINTDYDGGGSQMWALGDYEFITVDGLSVSLTNAVSNCGEFMSNPSTGATGNLTQYCGSIYVDLNGPGKGPNYFGKDLYWFYISNGRGALLYPAGGAEDGWWKNNYALACHDPSDKRGAYCAGRIFDDGWEMNY